MMDLDLVDELLVDHVLMVDVEAPNVGCSRVLNSFINAIAKRYGVLGRTF